MTLLGIYLKTCTLWIYSWLWGHLLRVHQGHEHLQSSEGVGPGIAESCGTELWKVVLTKEAEHTQHPGVLHRLGKEPHVRGAHDVILTVDKCRIPLHKPLKIHVVASWQRSLQQTSETAGAKVRGGEQNRFETRMHWWWSGGDWVKQQLLDCWLIPGVWFVRPTKTYWLIQINDLSVFKFIFGFKELDFHTQLPICINLQCKQVILISMQCEINICCKYTEKSVGDWDRII